MMTDTEPDDAAARWIARRQSGEMTAELWREYKAWLAVEDNRRAIAEYEGVLASLDVAGSAELANEFEAELHDEFARQIAVRDGDRRKSVLGPRALAASIAIAIAVGVSVFLAIPSWQPPMVYASRVGEQVNVALDDGSTATLNTNSTVAVKFSANKRGVEVREGEALFNVARDASRPFIVAMPLGEIRVTGTVFNVRALPGETAVHVVSGLVQVTPNGGEPIRLGAGESVHLDPSGKVVTERFDPASALAWRSGKARYADAALGDVIDDLNRYFSMPIVLADASLASLPVTGEFDVTDQHTAVAAITAAFDLSSRTSGSQIILSPTAPE